MNVQDTISKKPIEIIFSKAELTMLRKHFDFLHTLSDESKRPQTESQIRFVEVCRGEMQPETEFEKIWVKYQLLTELDRKLHSINEELMDLKEKYREALIESQKNAERIPKLESTIRSFQPPKVSEPTLKKPSGLFLAESEANQVIQALGNNSQYRFLKERIERTLRANVNPTSRGDRSSHQTCPACGGAGLGCSACSGTGAL